MKICFIGKVPPIQGGVCTRTYWMAYALARAGHQVWIVTNANEAEPACRMVMFEEDHRRLDLRFENGGSMRCLSSEPPKHDLYIPWAAPYVTTLASMATDVVQEHGCDLIYAYYLEPYGIAANLASQWTGVPYVLAHAGSDISVLMRQPNLRTAYVQALRKATKVVTATAFDEVFLSVGVRREQLSYVDFDALATHCYNPDAPPLDIDGVRRQALAENDWLHPCYRRLGEQGFDPSVPVLGMYGKVGKAKGMFDFVSALATLKGRGRVFQAALMVGGSAASCSALVEHVHRCGVQDEVTMLPFLPPWRIPAFITAMTATCFLERGFFIDSHTPGVPREVLACGGCLVLSGEIHAKRGYKEGLAHGDNALLVPDPRDHEVLADRLDTVVQDPDRAREIGAAGHRLSRAWENFGAYAKSVESDFCRYQEAAQ